jgi:hypothetical protein
MPRSSSRSPTSAVKARHLTSKPGRRADALEGWQPALAFVAFAALITLLVVPHPVEPEGDLPMPVVNRAELVSIVAHDDGLALAAARERLDVDVRELGSAYRAYGRAERFGRDDDVTEARRRITAIAGRALAVGEGELAKLRAFEARALLIELRRWEATGEESDDLVELGGGMLFLLHRSGWLTEPPVSERRKLVIDDDALRVVFKKRWATITGLEGGPLALRVDEERALTRFLLRHPPEHVVAAALDAGGTPGTRTPRAADGTAEPDEQRRKALTAGYRIKKIDELAAVDPTYPAAFAKGVLAYQLGQFPRAVDLLRAHLERAPDGRLAVRATNYLRAALERAGEE